MTIQVLHERGCSNRESAVRYRLARLASGAADGRAEKPFLTEALHEVIAHWLERTSERRGVNLQVLHEHLVAEHGYRGSSKSVQRYVRAKFPAPKVRTRRRVETPPGAQGQVDWGEFPGVVVGGQPVDLHASTSCGRTRGWRRSCGRSGPTSWRGCTCTTRRCVGWVVCRRCCASTT